MFKQSLSFIFFAFACLYASNTHTQISQGPYDYTVHDKSNNYDVLYRCATCSCSVCSQYFSEKNSLAAAWQALTAQEKCMHYVRYGCMFAAILGTAWFFYQATTAPISFDPHDRDTRFPLSKLDSIKNIVGRQLACALASAACCFVARKSIQSIQKFR